MIKISNPTTIKMDRHEQQMKEMMLKKKKKKIKMALKNSKTRISWFGDAKYFNMNRIIDVGWSLSLFKFSFFFKKKKINSMNQIEQRKPVRFSYIFSTIVLRFTRKLAFEKNFFLYFFFLHGC